MADLAKQPGSALGGATDHDGVGPGRFQHVLRLLRRGDVAVGDDRNAGCRLHRRDGFVLRLAGITTGAGATVDGQGLDAGFLGDVQDGQRVPVRSVPAGADLQGHRSTRHRLHHGLQDAAHQELVLQQGGAGHDVAHLLRRAAHVDVDDLGALARVIAGRLGHHGRIATGDLHRDRLDFAFVVGPALGLGRAVQQRIRGHHFRHRHAGAHLLAQLPERPIGDARHGRDDQIVLELEGTDAHERTGEGTTDESCAFYTQAPRTQKAGLRTEYPHSALSPQHSVLILLLYAAFFMCFW
ncbi:MAG: Uncharacterized protein FD132_2825 [bacterium]|nr:MAG: Uncharacterized protein FD132_2825 [bacterium]